MNDQPNTFISDNGEIIFINVSKMNSGLIGHLAFCKAECEKLEGKYGTDNIDEMFRRGITEKEMKSYITARHDLRIWGY